MITDKTAIWQHLEDTIRDEGHKAGVAEGFRRGYAQAMSDIGLFLQDRAPPQISDTDLSQPDDDERQRRPKGENARLIRDVLEEATKPHNASEIRRRVEKTKMVTITYSSTRNALHQLRDEGVAMEENGLWSIAKEAEPI